MPYSNLREVLTDLLNTTHEANVRGILQEIGDRSELTIDEQFGPFGLCWHPYGNNASNTSTVNLGTKPGRSLTERLTNAMDAILEDRLPNGITPPRSAREAAKQWFGRPVSGPDEGLFNWDFSAQSYDRRIAVVLNTSGKEAAPTIDVIDEGIGIKPDDFPDTILSLQSGNKIRKWYLIGAFGQGGSSSLSFCEYALIVSRCRDEPRYVGFTLVKVLRLNEEYKEDTYAYLAVKKLDGKITVPFCEVRDEYLGLYKPVPGIRLPQLKNGTMVRQYSYKLPNLAGNLSPSPKNLYHYLHCSMFDPLLPFRLIDLRSSERVRDELITGSRNRLMKLGLKSAEKGEKERDEEEKGSELKHHRLMEYIAPPGSSNPCIGIEYWVVFNYRKGSGKRKDDIILRPHSNELYVETGHPIIGSLNGQNQGELTGHFFRELDLNMVARHIVVHIDATNADSRVRRELFATTREGFKEGDVLTTIMQVLRKMLSEDGRLAELEKEITAKLAQKEAESTSEEVKRQVTRLLLDAGLSVSEEGAVAEPGGGEVQPVKTHKGKRPLVFDPLPTLPFPQVTRFEIVTPQPKLTIQQNSIEFVLVETDADAEFDRRGLVAIRTEPAKLELASKSPLRGGRIRWRLRPAADAKPGDSGKVIATLTKPDGTQLIQNVDFEVLAAVEEKAKKAKGLVPPFDIIPIDPIEDAEKWGNVWPDIDEESPAEQLSGVAYKPMRVGGAINVYYSKVFGPFKQTIERLLIDNPNLVELFRSNYEVWIGYHAILK